MNIDIKDVITLSDDNKYGVVSKTITNELTYYYLVDVHNNENLKFCVEEGDELIEVEDAELIQTLLPLFVNEIKEDLNELFSQE